MKKNTPKHLRVVVTTLVCVVAVFVGIIWANVLTHEDPLYDFNLGRKYLNAADYENAERYLLSALGSWDAQDEEGILRINELLAELYEYREDELEALVTWEAMLDYVEVGSEDFHMIRGHMRFLENEYEAAEEEYLQALELNKHNHRANRELEMMYKEGNLDRG